MTTPSFDLACVLPPGAAIATDAIVCLATTPQLQTKWSPMTSGGAFVPAATGLNQVLQSANGNVWSNVQVPTDGQTYGLANGVWTAVPTAAGMSSYLLKSGGVMTGTLTLSGAPVNPNDAATKAYVDSGTTAPIDCGTY